MVYQVRDDDGDDWIVEAADFAEAVAIVLRHVQTENDAGPDWQPHTVIMISDGPVLRHAFVDRLKLAEDVSIPATMCCGAVSDSNPENAMERRCVVTPNHEWTIPLAHEVMGAIAARSAPVAAMNGPLLYPAKCPRCGGCGKLADTDDREPWTDWLELPLASSAAVLAGIVKPVPCDRCGGTGSIASDKLAAGEAAS